MSASPLKAEPIIVTMSNVQPERVRWLVKNRIPLGKVTIFAGDPGLGKSFVAFDLAARVSQGRDVSNRGDVILLSAEDDPADTIRPRLDAAGADVTRIHLLKAIRELESGREQHERGLRLDSDMKQVSKAIQEHPQTTLVIIDPLSAYMGNTDARSDEQVRNILTPLATLAADKGVAIVCVKHLNKAEEKSSMYRAGGSIAFVAAARMAWMFVKAPSDSERRLMLLLKSNLSQDPGGLAYRIEQTDSGQGRVVWESEPVCDSLEDVFHSNNSGNRESALDRAKVWLQEFLKHGALAAKDIEEASKMVGISSATLRRASDGLHIQRNREGFGSGSRVTWSLPEQRQLEQGTQDG